MHPRRKRSRGKGQRMWLGLSKRRHRRMIACWTTTPLRLGCASRLISWDSPSCLHPHRTDNRRDHLKERDDEISAFVFLFRSSYLLLSIFFFSLFLCSFVAFLFLFRFLSRYLFSLLSVSSLHSLSFLIFTFFRFSIVFLFLFLLPLKGCLFTT